MLQYIEPPSLKQPRKNNNILYWTLTISFPNIASLSFKVFSISQLANILEMKEVTLKKILYNPSYNSKKYAIMLKYVSIAPVYASD